MRFLLAIFAAWFVIVLWPDPPAPPHPTPAMEEKVFLSTTCENSRWYLEDSDDQSATLACYPQPKDDNSDGDSH
jgi:hypothetical protein